MTCEPEVPAMLFGPDTLSVGRATAVVAIARGTIFLLSFAGLADD
jgi:hypothetical protein